MDEATAAELVGERVISVRRLPAASAATVQLVTTASGAEAIVKTAPPDQRWQVDKEAYVYGLIAQHDLDLPVPRVLRHLPGTLVLERLHGDDPAGVETTLLSRSTGSVLATLHRVELDGYGYLTADGVIDPRPTNRASMAVRFERLLDEHTRVGGDPGLRATIAGHVAERAELFDGCVRPVLCHDDAHEGNLLVDGAGRVVAVFDFQNAVAGDPLFDLAKTVYFSRRDRDVVREALAEGYGPLRGGWRAALDLYALYHQLELWVFFATLGVTEHLAGVEADIRAGL